MHADGRLRRDRRLLLRESLQFVGFQKIRLATSIGHIRPAALSAKSVPTLSTQAKLSGQFCEAFRVVIHHRASHHGPVC